MKALIILLILPICVCLSGCESLGWSGTAGRDIFTSGVNADTRVRTWDENGKPHETKIQSEPAYLYDAESAKVQK